MHHLVAALGVGIAVFALGNRSILGAIAAGGLAAAWSYPLAASAPPRAA